jgi:hypothetical protein
VRWRADPRAPRAGWHGAHRAAAIGAGRRTPPPARAGPAHPPGPATPRAPPARRGRRNLAASAGHEIHVSGPVCEAWSGGGGGCRLCLSLGSGSRRHPPPLAARTPYVHLLCTRTCCIWCDDPEAAARRRLPTAARTSLSSARRRAATPVPAAAAHGCRSTTSAARPPGQRCGRGSSIAAAAWPSVRPCSQNGYLSSRGGCQNRWHLLANCDHGDSTTSRFDSPAAVSRRHRCAPCAPRPP